MSVFLLNFIQFLQLRAESKAKQRDNRPKTLRKQSKAHISKASSAQRRLLCEQALLMACALSSGIKDNLKGKSAPFPLGGEARVLIDVLISRNRFAYGLSKSFFSDNYEQKRLT